MSGQTVDDLMIEAAALLDELQLAQGAEAVILANQLEERAERIKLSGQHLLEAANFSAKARLARARAYGSLETQDNSASVQTAQTAKTPVAGAASAAGSPVPFFVKIILACLLCAISLLSLFAPLSLGHLIGAVAVTVWLIGYGLYQMRAAWLILPALSFFLISYGSVCLSHDLLPDQSPFERINFALTYERDISAIKKLGKRTEFFGWNLRLPVGWQEEKQEIKNDRALCIWTEPVKEEGGSPPSLIALLVIPLSEDMQESLKINTAPEFRTSLIQQSLNGSNLNNFNILPGDTMVVGRVPYYVCPWDGILQVSNADKHYVGEMALLQAKGELIVLINGVMDEKAGRTNPVPRSLLISLKED